jgi:hypothetical protein
VRILDTCTCLRYHGDGGGQTCLDSDHKKHLAFLSCSKKFLAVLKGRKLRTDTEALGILCCVLCSCIIHLCSLAESCDFQIVIHLNWLSFTFLNDSPVKPLKILERNIGLQRKQRSCLPSPDKGIVPLLGRVHASRTTASAAVVQKFYQRFDIIRRTQ